LRESLKNTPCVADHDMMNADMFKQWVEGRLMPTFEALYGKGTALGGENGKKMIVIMGVYTMHLFFRLKLCLII